LTAELPRLTVPTAALFEVEMHRRIPVVPLFVAVALAGCSSDVAAPIKTATQPSFSSNAPSPGRYLVTFTGDVASLSARVQTLGGALESAHAGAGFAVVSGLTAAAASDLGGSVGVSDVEQDEIISLDSPIAAVQADAADVSPPAVTSQTNPTTASRYSWQWNMRLIGAEKAWAAGKFGSSTVTAAILDTGIDYDAPDLDGLVDLSRSISLMPSDDALTARYFRGRNNISDYNGHGTNVATQVSSKARALAGVTSKTTLIGVKVLAADGFGTFGSVLSGVLWAADHGADVANMSLGGAFSKAGNGRFVAIINNVFSYALQKGTLIVVSAGNELEDLDHNGNELATYCSVIHVVCVSAVGPKKSTASADEPAFYTNFGLSSIDVAAPGGNADAAHNFAASTWPWGVDIASWVWSYCSKTLIAGLRKGGTPIMTACQRGNRLIGYVGTSQAAPHVTGLAALLIAQLGKGQPSVIKQAIEASAVDLGKPGSDAYYGSGRISVGAALGL
jgi:hypothetical protein